MDIHWQIYEMKISIQYYITTFCLWIIQKINPSKDRNLSQVLFSVAENYNTSPGTNNYFTYNGKDCQEIIND